MTEEDKQRQVGRLVQQYQAMTENIAHLVERERQIAASIKVAADNWIDLSFERGHVRRDGAPVEWPASVDLYSLKVEIAKKQQAADEIKGRLADLGITRVG